MIRIIFITLILSTILSCVKVTQEDALRGSLSPKGALAMLGFVKDVDGNYIVAIKQNNLYDNNELRLSKTDANGNFITDITVFGANSKDGGKTVAGDPGQAGSGRLAYDPLKNQISLFTCKEEEVHQSSVYKIVSNDNASFGTDVSVQGARTFGHCFDQRTIYDETTKQFYQLAHGDAYPRTMGMFSANTDKISTFWRHIVAPPKYSNDYGGNITHTRIGDLAVFPNGTVAATVATPFYDNDFINSFLTNIPCYAFPNNNGDTNVKIFQAARDQKYPKNVILNLIPAGSSTILKNNAIGLTPDGINVSNYLPEENFAAAIPKVAIVGTKVLIAWLKYKNYNYNHAGTLDQTVFCVYDTVQKKVTRKDSVNGAILFHTVSILKDPSTTSKVKWITPNETEFIQHELDVTTFETSGLSAAYTKKSIPLNIDGAKTAQTAVTSASGQFGPLGWYGSNPEIDYIINKDGSMDIEWMNRNAATSMYGRNFYPILVTSIDNNGSFKKVVTIEVRASK